MTKIFIFAHFGLNVYHSLYFVALERLCLYNREISLAALLRQNSKTNMTKNRDKIMIFKKKNHDIILVPYRSRLAWTFDHCKSALTWTNMQVAIPLFSSHGKSNRCFLI